MTSARIESAPEIGVIGGSGFYSLLTGASAVTVETPYGEPSAPVTVGDLAGRRVAFLPRHGTDHRFPPHRVPYRANVWALRSLGVRQLLTASAVGSLLAEWGPGTIVLPDQILDRTWGRARTYHLDADDAGVYSDLGYNSDPHHQQLRNRDIKSVITKRRIENGCGLGKFRWVLEWTHWWLITSIALVFASIVELTFTKRS